jgi:hypothetical protein
VASRLSLLRTQGHKQRRGVEGQSGFPAASSQRSAQQKQISMQDSADAQGRKCISVGAAGRGRRAARFLNGRAGAGAALRKPF